MSLRRTVPAVLLVLALGACSTSSGPADTAAASSGDKALLTPYGAPVPTGGDKAAAGEMAAGSADMAASGGTTGGSVATAPREVLRAPAQTGPLRAASVDDNAHFSDYLAFLKDMRQAGLTGDPLDVSERHVVTVVDEQDRPVLAARVELLDGQRVVQTARTHADGRALLFPKVAGGGDTVRVTYRGERVERPLDDVRVQLDQARADAPVRLDLHFLVDTTGSMGDEIDRLTATLDDVAKQISELPQQPQVRYGLTAYRDHGDAYVSTTHDFTDLATFRKELGRLQANGGGDTPEALDEAFHGAVNGPSWDSDRAVQVAFLVADASPHLDDQDAPSYAKDVLVAQAKGIEVVPLASSGSDDAAELVFRQLAEYSLGTFFFLTYGADGASPGDGTDRHVDGYQAGSLDALVVAHVKARLAALGR